MLMDIYRPLLSAALAVVAISACAPASAEFQFEPYGAASGAFSRLTPEEGGSGLDLSDSNGFGYSLVLGADLADRWAIEGAFSDLGDATFSGPAVGEEDISYTVLGVSGLFHLFGNSRSIADRNGIWSYLRLGFSQIDNDSDLDLEEADNTALWAGIGFEWAFASRLAFRGELATFDGDAQAVTAGLVYRPFNQAARSISRAPTRRPSTQTAPIPQTPPAPLEPPRRLPIPSVETPAVVPRVALVGCETSVGREPVGADGCALLTGVRRDLQFVGNTAQLTRSSASSIAAIANTLRSAPGTRIEIRAHAQAPGGLNAAQDLSRQRAVAVARALVGAGIQVNRLAARAFGNNEPVVAFGSSAGELLPNRIEFAVQR